LNFSKPITYNLENADANVNSSAISPNIYVDGLETLIRIEIRYAQYLCMIKRDF